MAYPKSLRVLEVLHYGGDLPLLHDEHRVTVRRQRSGAKNVETFNTERRFTKVKLDRMEAWYHREQTLTDFHCWKDSSGNEILQSTFGMIQEYLEVYPEALSSIDRLERNGDREDDRLRREAYRRNNVNSKWLSDKWLATQTPRKGRTQKV